MKERPIIMIGESVRAILAGRKTQTRRVCKNQTKQPYEPGDRLWVKESYIHCDNILMPNGQRVGVTDYRANRDNSTVQWKNSMFMPKRYSRITLEVTGVWIERLQNMTIDDAVAEGFGDEFLPHRYESFIKHWDQLNAKRGFPWESNPFVWVIEFKRIEKEK